METEKVYAMPFAKIYPMLVAKAVRKGRTQAEVDEMIGWLTGYSAPQIEAAVQNGTLYGDFFRDAPQLNPDSVFSRIIPHSLSVCNRLVFLICLSA